MYRSARLTRSLLRIMSASMLAVLMSACGGSGGGSSEPTPPPAPPPPPTVSELNSASRFAATATFGLSYPQIDALARQGKAAWLEQQFNLPVGEHVPIVADLFNRRQAGEFTDFEEDIEFLIMFRRFAWWHKTVTSSDVLRQRIAFALSEIFVVSDNVDALIINPFALSGYYDMLLNNAFGNYRDLLRDITLHPAMGIYLSHINNRRADPANNIFPDENYAREVMQLFSIGLFELNIDGSLVLDDDGQPIPTYDNNDIREFAKIFTGLSYGGQNAYFGNPVPNFFSAMQMFSDMHEPGTKTLLNGTVVPAGQSGEQDIEDAIDNLFNHPNVGPFIGKQLIQRLVTSNPSPSYVARGPRVLNAATSGVRGDMRAVVRAVLLDPEAGAAPDSAGTFGKLREPVVRYASILRQFGAKSDDNLIANAGFFFQSITRQHPLSSPSVFNFFLPSHSPAGEIADAELVAPEFEITTSSTIVGISNIVDYIVLGGFVTDTPEPFAPVSLTLDDYVSLAANVEALVDRLDILLTAGTLDPQTRQVITAALADIDDVNFRLSTALFMFLISPDYAVRL